LRQGSGVLLEFSRPRQEVIAMSEVRITTSIELKIIVPLASSLAAAGG